MLRTIFQHEWRCLVADRSLAAIAGLFVILAAYGVFGGVSWQRERAEAVRRAMTEADSKLAEQKNELIANTATGKTVVPWRDPANPFVVSQAVTSPPGPMAGLAVGQSELYPYNANPSIFAIRHTLFTNYDLDNPMVLSAGRFDLGFVIVFLYPLLILAISYNMLSSERERGTLAMTLSQPVPLRTLLLGKVGLRAMVVVGMAAVLSVAGALAARVPLEVPGVPARVLLWTLLVVAYGLFWFAVALAVNAIGKSSGANAMILASIWIALVLVVPSLLNVAVSRIYPPPSRYAFLERVRGAENETQKIGQELLKKYYFDHPELGPKGDPAAADDFMARFCAVREELARRVDPEIRRFEEQLANQQRLVSRARFLSPAIAMQEAVSDVSGTGLVRQKKYEEQAVAFVQKWKALYVPKVFQSVKLTPADYDAVPRFRFEEEPLAAIVPRVSSALLGLLLPALGIAALGLAVLSRYRIAG